MAFCPFRNDSECSKDCKLYLTEKVSEYSARGTYSSKRSYCAIAYLAIQANNSNNVEISCAGDDEFDKRYIEK